MTEVVDAAHVSAAHEQFVTTGQRLRAGTCVRSLRTRGDEASAAASTPRSRTRPSTWWAGR